MSEVRLVRFVGGMFRSYSVHRYIKMKFSSVPFASPLRYLVVVTGRLPRRRRNDFVAVVTDFLSL